MRFSSTKSLTKAKRTIFRASHVPVTQEKQKAKLAAAHCKLARQKNISRQRMQFHLNAAVTLLQSVDKKNAEFISRIIRVYFMRAEAYEAHYDFYKAALDYQKIINLAKQNHTLTDEDRLLIAQSYIAITDISINEEMPHEKQIPCNPKTYISKALSELGRIKTNNNRSEVVTAYAYQTAGIAIAKIDRDFALRIYHKALNIALAIPDEMSCSTLSDIYACMGLLYHYKKRQASLIEEFDYGMIYFSLSLCFSSATELATEPLAFDALLDIIQQLSHKTFVPLAIDVVVDFTRAVLSILERAQARKLNNKMMQSVLGKPGSREKILCDLGKVISQYVDFNCQYTKIRQYSITKLDLDLTDFVSPPPDNVVAIKI